MAEIITRVTVDSDGARSQIEKLTSAIERNKQNTKDLQSDLKSLGRRTATNAKEYDSLSERIALNKAEVSQLTRERRVAIQANNAEAGSMEALKAKLAQNAQERNKLNLSTKEGAQRADELNSEMHELTGLLKDQEEAGGNFGRNVGNYASGFDNMSGALSTMNPALGGSVQGFKAMNAQLLTMLANPIGLVLLAIVGALKAMSMWVTRTAEGQGKWAEIQATLGGYLESFFDIVSAIGKYLFNTLVPVFKIVVSNIQAVYHAWSALGHAMTFDFEEAKKSAEKSLNSLNESLENGKEAINNAVDGFKTMSSEIKTVAGNAEGLAKQMGELAKEEHELQNSIRQNTVNHARRGKEIQELILLTRDETRSFAERREALKKSMDLEKRQMEEKEYILAKELKIAKERDNAYNSTIEDAQAVADAEAKLLNFQAQRLAKQRELVNRQNELANKEKAQRQREATERAKIEADRQKAEEEAEAKRLEDIEKAEAEAQRERDTLFALNQYKAQLNAEEIEDERLKAEALVQIEKDALAHKLENEKLNENEREKLRLESEHKQAKITEDANKRIQNARIKSREAEIKAEGDTKRAREIQIKGYLSASQQMYSLLSDFAGEHSAGMKALAVGNAIINTYLGVTQALASSPPPLSFVMAGITVAQGLSAVSKILSTNPSTSGGGSVASGGGGSISSSAGASAGASVDTAQIDAQISQEEALEGALKSANLKVSVTEINEAQTLVTESEEASTI